MQTSVRMKKTYPKIAFAAFLLFVVDRYLKWLAAEWLVAPLKLTPWITLVYEQNFGIAWSLPVPKEVILPLNIVLIGFAAYYLPAMLDLRKKTTFLAVSLALGGALGNIYDRLAFGYVVDFIKIGWWPVFNLADVFLSVGIFIIIVFYGKIKRHN